MEKSDHDLLRDYARNSAQDAFAALVKRHLNLVFSAAQRQLRSRDLAEEVAQSVFLDLARSARRLTSDTVLPAWLFTVTRRTAIDVVRRETSRQHREHTAVEIAAMHASDPDWSHIEPLLDEAIEHLEPDDRTAIILRFFENQSLREVGRALEISDDAAQKRVSRALDRLRAVFASRGLATASAVLAAQISAHAIQTAPASLVHTISSATTVAEGLGLGGSAVVPAIKGLVITTSQKALIAITVLVTGGGLYEAYIIRGQRQRIDALEARTATLALDLAASEARAESARHEIVATDAVLSDAEQALADLARLQAGTAALNSPDLRAWIARNQRLKSWVERLPQHVIPEMRFLTESDWLQAAREAELETEIGARKAMDQLRLLAKKKFLAQLRIAVERHVAANNQAMSPDIQALVPYFDPPIEVAILQRYKVGYSGPIANTPQGAKLVIEHARADDEFETEIQLERHGAGWRSVSRVSEVIHQASQAYQNAHGGSSPSDTRQIIPFLPDPDDPAVLQKIEDLARASAP